MEWEFQEEYLLWVWVHCSHRLFSEWVLLGSTSRTTGKWKEARCLLTVQVYPQPYRLTWDLKRIFSDVETFIILGFPSASCWTCQPLCSESEQAWERTVAVEQVVSSTRKDMNNHFGFCVPNTLMNFMFHCGKIERQLSRLLWRSLPLPRTKFSRSGTGCLITGAVSKPVRCSCLQGTKMSSLPWASLWNSELPWFPHIPD